MFVHHVFFWLNEPASERNKNALLEGLKTLEEIEPKLSFHIGAPASTTRKVIDNTYTLSLLILFKNLDDQEAYQSHPVHLSFVENCSTLWQKVLVYDSVDASNFSGNS